MKLIHLSDLHLGKRVNEFSMLEDQRYILEQISDIMDEEAVDGVIIAGDVYDRTVPCVEAVQLFDDFLVRLSQKHRKVFIISGNHDSPERLSFGNRLMEAGGVYVSDVYDGEPQKVELHDEYGTLNVWLLPFVRPSAVKRYFPDDNINSYSDAVSVAIRHMDVDFSARNILISHQFVTGASLAGSEELNVGGLDDVSFEVFDGFDYVALGHIHSAQSIGSDCIRYCGTPLKYSLSEVNDKKSVTILEIKEKGNVNVKLCGLFAKRDMYRLRGSYFNLTARTYYENQPFKEGYVEIILTDEEDVPDALGKLRVIYPYIMKLGYDNTRTRISRAIEGVENVAQKNPLELFKELYFIQNNREMTEEQASYAEKLIENIWEEGEETA